MNKNVKKFLPVFMCVSMLISLFAVCSFANEETATAYNTTVSVLKYEIVDNHAVVTDCNENASDTIEIPSEYNGYPVTEIGGNAFRFCNKITKVIISEGVEKISYSAFSMCSKLKEITLPASLITIEASAFERCGSLDNVVIPSGVTEVADYTFYECTSLENVKLPAKIVSIGESAFCKTAIKKIELPAGLKTIGSSAFNTTPLEEIVIPYGVTAIYDSAFRYCKNLAEVKLSDTVEEIGSYAFYGSEKMKSIKIPASVKEMYYMCVGYNNEIVPISLFTIYGTNGSKAEQYAASNRIGFVDSDDDSALYDVDGDGNITASDARMALRGAAKINPLTGRFLYAADIDKDGVVTAIDARKILRKAAQLD